MKSASELAKSVVVAANHHDAPSAAAEARVWQGVAAGVAAGNPGPTLAETSSAPAGGSSATLIKIALAIVVVGAGAAIGVGLLDDDPEVARVEPATKSLAADTSEPPPAPEPLPVVVPEPEPVPEEESSAPQPPAKERPTPQKAIKSDTLADEVALLKKGREALRAGNAAAADRHLREHARKFPRSKLARERDLTRVKALCKLGKKKAATGVAHKLLARDASAVLRDRIAKTCVDL